MCDSAKGLRTQGDLGGDEHGGAGVTDALVVTECRGGVTPVSRVAGVVARTSRLARLAAASAVLAGMLVTGAAAPQPAAAAPSSWGYSVLAWDVHVAQGKYWYLYYYNKCHDRPGRNRLVSNESWLFYVRYRCYDVLS